MAKALALIAVIASLSDAIGKTSAKPEEKDSILKIAEEIKASAEAEFETINQELLEQKSALENALQVNGELQKELEKLELQVAAKPGEAPVVAIEKPKIPDATFKVGEKSYKFTLPQFSYNGEKLTAEQAIKDKNLCAELVEIGFGGIEQVG